MKSEMLEIVLQEILNEQKETNLINAQLAAYIKSLSDKIYELDKRINKMSNWPEVDYSKLQEQLKGQLDNIKNAIETKPEGVIHKKIFQFFPAQNVREYYEVYGNLLKWLALFGVTCIVIHLVRDLLEKQGFL